MRVSVGLNVHAIGLSIRFVFFVVNQALLMAATAAGPLLPLVSSLKRRSQLMSLFLIETGGDQKPRGTRSDFMFIVLASFQFSNNESHKSPK